MTTAWHTLDAATVATRLETDPLRGLDSEIAQRRLTTNGQNTLREAAPVRPWKLLAEQFKSPLVLLLFAAAFVSGALGEWVDSSAISIIVILNAVIGFFQEYRAEQAIAALKKMTAPSARVLRNGHAVSLPAAEIVAGDVLLMESGDLVAADARLLHDSDLRIRESALTGESMPVEKDAEILLDTQAPLADRMNLVFMGTTVVTGTGRAVIPAIAWMERPNMDEAPPEFKGREYTVEMAEPNFLAALYETWIGCDGATLDSCTVITGPSDEIPELRGIWHERTPIILTVEEAKTWLDPMFPPDAAIRLLRGVKSPPLKVTEVPMKSPRDNSLF
jgi:hypothetical protein